MSHAKHNKATVFCETSNWTTCEYAQKGKCTRDEVHLILSYGRSTEYAERFMCQDRKTIAKAEVILKPIPSYIRKKKGGKRKCLRVREHVRQK